MKTVAVVALVLVGVVGCWGARSVREPPEALVEFAPEAKVRQVWSADFGAGTKYHAQLVPYLAGNEIYTADAHGRVSAFAADSGRRLWEVELEVGITGAIAAGETAVLVGTNHGEVLALARTDGKLLWKANVSSEVLARPVEAAGVVVAQTVDGKLFGLSAVDGKRLWTFERTEPALSLRGTSAPVLVADKVITGFASGKIVAVQLQDGRLSWELSVAVPRGRNEIERLVDVDAPVLIVNDMLYAASFQGKLVAVNLRTGTMVWSRDVSTYTGMTADGKNIYLSDEKSQILAFDQRSGASVWKQDKLRGRFVNAPAHVGDFIAVGDFEGYVHWLAVEDGHFVARYQIANSPIRAPGVAEDDTLFIATQGGSITALRAVTK